MQNLRVLLRTQRDYTRVARALSKYKLASGPLLNNIRLRANFGAKYKDIVARRLYCGYAVYMDVSVEGCCVTVHSAGSSLRTHSPNLQVGAFIKRIAALVSNLIRVYEDSLDYKKLRGFNHA